MDTVLRDGVTQTGVANFGVDAVPELVVGRIGVHGKIAVEEALSLPGLFHREDGILCVFDRLVDEADGVFE